MTMTPGLNIIKCTFIFTRLCLSSHNKSILLFVNTPTDLNRNPSQGSGGFSEGSRIQYTTLQPAHIIRFIICSSTGIIHFQPCGQRGWTSLSVLPRRKIASRIMTSLHGIILQLCLKGSRHQSSLQPLLIHFSHIAFR